MKDSIRRLIPLAISAVTIVVTLIIQFAVFSVNERFDWSEFLPQLAINIFLLVSMAVIWINAGTDRAKREENSAYKTNAELYAVQIKKVTDGNRLGDLRAFCRVKSDEMLDSKITITLANAGIDRKLYNDTLKTLTDEQLKADGYNKRQRRAISRVKSGRVRVAPIRAINLLSDSKTVDDYGVNYDEQADKARRISFRAVRSVFTALVLAVLSIEPAQDLTNIAAWVMFFMRLFTIVWTAYSSDHEGYARIAETKNKVFLRRIAFLHEFDEWAKVPRLNNGKSGG
ncbi:MAG: hypothetical protein J1G01_04590 [Clostridiales bacterium]|nr:hypothetical protein [Clostridiales bacterium]